MYTYIGFYYSILIYVHGCVCKYIFMCVHFSFLSQCVYVLKKSPTDFHMRFKGVRSLVIIVTNEMLNVHRLWLNPTGLNIH